ncbi:MAG: type II toxin-antitoxin system CcdA family antitoxin [Polynucleobacter sp.]
MIIHNSSRIGDRPLKRATNLTLTSEVLEEAKKLGINISKVCDTFLESLVKQEKERLWKLENTKFIDEYNQLTDKEGLPLDKWRSF